eukprot:3060024-Prymnesium_polylepis.1
MALLDEASSALEKPTSAHTRQRMSSRTTTWLSRCASALGVSEAQVRATETLLRDEATVPFIVRYRQDATGGLDEPQVRGVLSALQAHDALEARRKTVLRQLEKAAAAPEVVQAAEAAEELAVLEDV